MHCLAISFSLLPPNTLVNLFRLYYVSSLNVRGLGALWKQNADTIVATEIWLNEP